MQQLNLKYTENLMLKDEITKFMIASMKNKQAEEVSVARLIIAKIKELEINNRTTNKQITNDDTIALLKQMVKQRIDSVLQYTNANRLDLAQKEQAEITIINKFLPEQFSAEKTTEIVKQTIAELKIESVKEMGKIIAHIKQNYANNVDMALVSTTVKSILS